MPSLGSQFLETDGSMHQVAPVSPRFDSTLRNLRNTNLFVFYIFWGAFFVPFMIGAAEDRQGMVERVRGWHAAKEAKASGCH